MIVFFSISIASYSIEYNKDSLFNVLDKVIQKRPYFLDLKNRQIDSLKTSKRYSTDINDILAINKELINEYNSFICDSAEFYIKQNLEIGTNLEDENIIIESLLNLSYVYSLSGLFFEASKIFESLEYDNLPDHFKAWYCWNYIRYFENMIIYINDPKHSDKYVVLKKVHRDMLMELLDESSSEYKKELTYKLQQSGQFDYAEEILLNIYNQQEPHTHQFAMASMSLAKHYAILGDVQKENYYLARAAITDTQLAVKENEALLSLAENLFKSGDVDRAYNYIRIALEDALFYNARFKNTIITRIHPFIEDTYLQKIQWQQKNLRLYSYFISIFAIILIVSLYYLFRQIKATSRAKKELRLLNDNLIELNKKLDEANIVKEHYIGYFMNQCSVYINKLHKFRKNVKLNIKTGQISNLQKISTDELEKDINELHVNFDKAFLTLYPSFAEEFNALLRPEEQFTLVKDKLNNETRIFALTKLGITDVKQIANFLHYSVQTVYNYKSKVKSKSIIDSDKFEEEVIKIGSI